MKKECPLENPKALRGVFWALFGSFVALIAYFTILTFFFEMNRALFAIAAILGLAVLILGVILIALTKKQKVKGKLKIFLYLTGFSAISPFAFSILHNLFYALSILGENIALIKYPMEFLDVTSLIIAVIIGPMGFLVGLIGTIILFRKTN